MSTGKARDDHASGTGDASLESDKEGLRLVLPTMDLMRDSFERGDYDRFRQLARAPGGRKLLEDNAETLLSYFLESDGRRVYRYPRRSNVSVAGLRVLLEEIDPTPVNIQALLSRILLRAVFELDVEKAQVCLQAGASPNAPVSTLHELIKRYQRTVGVRVNLTGLLKEKMTQQNSKRIMDLAECLCEHGADVHKVDGQGSTPVQLLLQCCGQPTQGLRADAHEDQHVSMATDASTPMPKPGKRPCPYDECAAHVLAILIRHGGKLPDPLLKPQSSPLQSLLIQGFSALVMEMVENGASVHTTDDLECTPLHCAILYGSPEVVECMLRRGGPAMGLNFEQSTESVSQPTCTRGVLPSTATAEDHSNTCCTESTERLLINSAVRRGNVQILQLLKKVGIVVTNRIDLLIAAFSLDPAVVKFLLSSNEWTDTDIVDALKLQAAVFHCS